MTLSEVINTLDLFRDEYNTSTDPEVKKLCGYVNKTIDDLNAYLQFFASSKSRIEQSQQFYEHSLETLNNLLGSENSVSEP